MSSTFESPIEHSQPEFMVGQSAWSYGSAKSNERNAFLNYLWQTVWANLTLYLSTKSILNYNRPLIFIVNSSGHWTFTESLASLSKNHALHCMFQSAFRVLKYKIIRGLRFYLMLQVLLVFCKYFTVRG